jgi:trimeric autotransporter adhesin
MKIRCVLLSGTAGPRAPHRKPPRSIAQSQLVVFLLPLALVLALALPLSSATPGDENWERRFALPFLNGAVSAFASSGDDLFVGGAFTLAGAALAEQGITVNHLFQWRNGVVSGVGEGFNGAVHAIAIDGDDLYVGGAFTEAGGVAANRVARWDGEAWSALGGGIDGTVYALAVHNGELYAGGQFTSAGGVTVNGIARWTGSEWLALASGLGTGGIVRALTFTGGQLYAGGSFFLLQIIDGLPVLITNLARWDGQAWAALGSGVNHQVSALLAHEDLLYAGGTFTTAGGMSANKLAAWNGQTWSALGAGFSTGILDSVNALVIFEGQLHAGGHFTDADGEPANALARWDGNRWIAVEEGVINSIGGILITRGTVSALATTTGRLHVGGNFNRAGTRETSNFATWETDGWRSLGLGLNGGAFVVHATGGDVLVGGHFMSAGGKTVNGIARWTGTDWLPLGAGVHQGALQGQVHALATRGADVYAAGVFDRAGEVSALNIARWDGTQWFPLGTGLGGNAAVVRALVLGADGTLYAGGFFNAGGDISTIAKWDGSTWSALGSGLSAGQGFAEVRALAAWKEGIYAAGAFNNAGGISTVGIARWDGAAWTDVGGGMDSSVLALVAHPDHLYAGGYFTTAGGVAARRVARWNGSAWSALGDGLGVVETDFVHALAVDGDRLFAGGSFVSPGEGASANNLAEWNGTTWLALGSGTGAGSPPAVYGMAAGQGRLYVGGTFAQVGGFTSVGFGIWNGSDDQGLRPRLRLARQADGGLVLRFTGAPGSNLQVWSTAALSEPFTPRSGILLGTGAELVYEEEAAAGSARYYQLRLLP